MPRLWTETIAAHRAAVEDAVLDAVAALVAEHGLASVRMSQIAERTGIGRATLYKYFADLEAVLAAWHERQITRHLAELAQAKDAAGPGPRGQLQAVLEACALRVHQRPHHGSDLAALLHQGEHVARAQQELHAFVTRLVADAAREGEVRDDIVPGELASYCLYAVTAASILPSEAAARRLVGVTLDGLRAVPDRPNATAEECSTRHTTAARSGALRPDTPARTPCLPRSPDAWSAWVVHVRRVPCSGLATVRRQGADPRPSAA